MNVDTTSWSYWAVSFKDFKSHLEKCKKKKRLVTILNPQICEKKHLDLGLLKFHIK